MKTIEVGDVVKFIYNKRKVHAEITFTSDKMFIGVLKSNYIGKNSEWIEGQHKEFWIKIIKKLTFINEIKDR